MVGPSLQEIADRAIYMLLQRGVTVKHVKEGVGVTETRIKQAINRIENGRYGDVPVMGVVPGERKTYGRFQPVEKVE